MPRKPKYSDIPASHCFAIEFPLHFLPKKEADLKTNMSGSAKAIRLPPLKTLRVHNPKRQPENPCIAIMSSVLGMYFKEQKV